MPILNGVPGAWDAPLPSRWRCPGWAFVGGKTEKKLCNPFALTALESPSALFVGGGGRR